MDIRVGDVITLKKQHPCGSKEWEVLRIGADFRLKCKGCDQLGERESDSCDYSDCGRDA